MIYFSILVYSNSAVITPTINFKMMRGLKCQNMIFNAAHDLKMLI